MYGTSAGAVKRDRAALVLAGLLETRNENGRATVTAAPGRLPAPSQTGAQISHNTGLKSATTPGSDQPHRSNNY